MRAAYVEENGGPDKLKIGDQPKPTATADGVLVRVRAAGIGPWDNKIVSGMFGQVKFPFIPGLEVAGEVAEADSAGRFEPGDAVFGDLGFAGGGLAEYVVIPAGLIARKSEQLSFAEAAALVVGGGTAYEGIIDRGQLKAGETVLITAAAGGVGTAAVQIAASTGARVFGVASANNRDYLISLGAEQVFDYHDADWVEQIHAAAPDGVDLLFDGTGNETLNQAITAVRKGGRAVFIAGPPKTTPDGVSGDMFSAAVNTERLDALNKLVEEGKLRAEVQSTLPLDKVAEAFQQIEDGHTRGKIIINID